MKYKISWIARVNSRKTTYSIAQVRKTLARVGFTMELSPAGKIAHVIITSVEERKKVTDALAIHKINYLFERVGP